MQVGSFDNRRAMIDVGDRLGNRAAVRATAMYKIPAVIATASGSTYGIDPTFAMAAGADTIVRAGYEHFPRRASG